MQEPMRRFVLGVTGAVGAGKSTVCRALLQHGFAVLDVDDVAAEALGELLPELAQLVPFLVLARGGVRHEKAAPPAGGQLHDERHEEEIELPEVCSTAVRERLREGKLPHGWVARGVLSYIREQGLYLYQAAAPPEAPGPESAPPSRHRHRPELGPEASADGERGSK